MHTTPSTFVAISMCFLGALSYAADLESLAKSAVTAPPETTKAFTEQELIDHVRGGNFDKYGDSICPGGYLTYIPKARLTNEEHAACHKRLRAFSDGVFGSCQLMQLYSNGGNLMGLVLKYTTTPNEDTTRRQEYLKNINGYLESFKQSHPSTGCTPAHYEAIKNLANKVLDAATQVTDEVKQREAEKKTAEQRTRAEADAKQKALATCKENNAFKLYEVNSAILGLQAENNQFKAAIDREKAAGKVSGYVNQGNLNHLGQRIVINEDRITRFFVRYRELGGSASKAESIKPLTNPCL